MRRSGPASRSIASGTGLAVSRKDGKTDAVTSADHDAQQAVIDRIERTFPDDTVYGEEAGTDTKIAGSGLL